MKRVAAFACLLVWVSNTQAETNSATRVRAFAALPEWPGIWQSAAWLTDASGRPPGGEVQIKTDSLLLRPPPYNAEWLIKYRTTLDNVAAIAAKNAALKICTRSFPALMEGPSMFQLAVLPNETLLIFENGQVRHIYTDGRRHPSDDELWPTPLGNSIGHWENQTLFIDTVSRTASAAITPRAWASTLSEAAYFLERIHQQDDDTLIDELTVYDPIALIAPWRMTLRFKRLRNMTRMLANDCNENDRNPLIDGKISIAPAS